MLITCPHCFAKFNLPETQVTEDTKLRCSFCDTVFSLQEGTKDNEITHETTQSQQEESKTPIQQEQPLPKATNTKRRSFSFGVFLFLALFAITGVWLFVHEYKKGAQLDSKNETTTQLLQEQIKELSINDYRQHFITNNKNIDKPFFVVEGKIKNNSKESKAFIVVRASLFNDKGEMIIEQEMLAGVALSLFQLQTMKEEDMLAILRDPLEIAVTNSNVLPQNEVPFMILFFDPPREITEFSIQIVSANKAENIGSN